MARNEPYDMPEWVHEFLKLVSVEVQNKCDDVSPYGERLEPRLREKSTRVKFHFPVEEMELAGLLVDGRTFEYNRDGIAFQWKASSINSEYVEDEKTLKPVLVGVIEAMVIAEVAGKTIRVTAHPDETGKAVLDPPIDLRSGDKLVIESMITLH